MDLRKFVLTALASLSFATSAGAQTTPTDIARRELIEQAEAARVEGNHERALDLATRASQIRVTTSLRLLLAQEHAAVGHLLDAFDQANSCAREAADDASLRNRERILDACRALAATLAQQVGHVVVRVPPGSEAMVVRVAGTEVNPALWGEPFPVAPGEVQVDALATSGARFHGAVTVQPGGREEIAVVLGPAPPPARVVPDPRHTQVTVGAQAVVPGPALAAPVDGRDGNRRVSHGAGAGPWVFFGLGAAAFGASVAFYLLANDAQAGRDTECGLSGRGGRCVDRALAEGFDQDYRTYTTLTNISFAVGGASLAVGALWLILGRGTDARPPRAVTWRLAPFRDGAVFQLAGAL